MRRANRDLTARSELVTSSPARGAGSRRYTAPAALAGAVLVLAAVPAGATTAAGPPSRTPARVTAATAGAADPCIRTVRVYRDDEGFWHGVGYNCSLYGGNRSLRYADGMNYSQCAFVEGKSFHDWIIPDWAAQGPITMVSYCV
ncbi:hypothetical protein GCM10023088_15260 [Actinomadura verrucosospora]